MTTIRLKWLLDVVDRGGADKVLKQDRAIRASLTQTDTAYSRVARAASSTGDKQASAASRTATALKREGGAVAGVSAEVGRYAAAQREALTIGSRIVPQVDKVTGAYSRQAKAAKAAHTEQSRLSKIGSGGSGAARKVGTVVGGGVLAAGYAAFSGIHEGGELAKEVAGLKGLTGLTGREAQALAVTTKALDINTRQVGQSFGTLGKQVIGLAKGTASSVDVFKRLQISPTEADKLKNNLPALFDLVYKRAQKLPQAERASVLKQVLGRGGTTAGQIEALGPLAGQLHGAEGELSGIDPKKLEELHVEETKLKIATTGLKLEFASAAAGPLKNFTSRLAELTRLARKGEWSKFGTSVGKMSEEVGKAAEKVLPHIADAFAKAGPKVLLSFGRGFAHASLGGQVVLGAALLTKLGLTQALFAGGGTKAVRWFAGGLAGGSRLIASAGGRLAGAATGAFRGLASKMADIASGAASGAASRLGAGEALGSMKGAGGKLGKALGKGLLLGATVFLAAELGKALGALINEIKVSFHPENIFTGGKVFSINVGSDQQKFRKEHGIPEHLNPERHPLGGKRRGGIIRRYAGGGLVDAMVSPGEMIVHGDSAWTVPGTRTAADSVYTQLPVGAAVLTSDGQHRVASGASLGEAIATQAPHFAKGGFVSTAYGPPWGGIEGTGTTATGIDLHNSPKVYIVAVDPSVIPLHSKLKISPNPFGYSGNFAAEDTGGAIKGNRIDFYDWKGRADQDRWGRRNVTVTTHGTAGGLSGAGTSSTKVTQDIMLGRSRTRAGLVPDAFSQGVEAGLAGLTSAEVRRANRGARGARVNPIVSAITQAFGPVSRTLTAAGGKRQKTQGAGGPSRLALGGTEKSGTFAGVRVGVADMVRETLKANPGLSVTSTTGGKHASGSLHYQGRAVDIAGANMNGASDWVKAHYGRVLTEGIHNPNLSIKYGKTVPSSTWGEPTWGEHKNHIHMALRRGGIVGTVARRADQHHGYHRFVEWMGRSSGLAIRPGQEVGGGQWSNAVQHYLHTNEHGVPAYAWVGQERPGDWWGKWNRGETFRWGGNVGGRSHAATPSKLTVAVHDLQLASGNTTKIEAATTALDEAIGKLTIGKLNALVLRFRTLAQRGGKANAVKSFQSVIDEAEFAIGERIGNIGDKIAQRTSNLERSRGAFDRGLRRVGTDPASGAGLTATIGFDDREKVQRERSVKDAEHAKKIAEKSGNKDKIKEATEALHAAQDELDESIVKGIEDRRAQLRQAAQETTDTAQFNVQSVQNSLADLDIAQRLSRTNETPGGLTQKAAAIEGSLIPALQASLGALNSQLGTLQSTGAGASEIQAVLGGIQSAGNEIGSAMAEAADLIRQAAEQAADELVEKAAHRTSLAQTGLQHKELEERIAGTFDTSGQQNADYIRNTIIPAVEGEIAALANQRKVAEEQGNPKLAEQIAEAIAQKQNGVLEDILQANEDVAGNTDPKNKVGGTLGFNFAGENVTDALIAVGQGM